MFMRSIERPDNRLKRKYLPLIFSYYFPSAFVFLGPDQTASSDPKPRYRESETVTDIARPEGQQSGKAVRRAQPAGLIRRILMCNTREEEKGKKNRARIGIGLYTRVILKTYWYFRIIIWEIYGYGMRKNVDTRRVECIRLFRHFVFSCEKEFWERFFGSTCLLFPFLYVFTKKAWFTRI